jgi:hypothetical protein
MSLNPTEPLSIQEVNVSTLAAVLLSLILGLPLLLIQPFQRTDGALLAIVIASGIFWGVLSIIVFRFGWNIYYKYFFPSWMRKFGALNSLSYALITAGIWHLANAWLGNFKLVFLLIGGIEGVLEHVIGIYNLKILEKVPWLQGLPVPNLLLFSFFEYIVYWAIVLFLAHGIQWIVGW